MKKTILSLAILATAALSANAQLYVKANVGYATGADREVLGATITKADEADETTEVNYGSFGSGPNAGLEIGYQFSENFAFGINAQGTAFGGERKVNSTTYTDYGTYTQKANNQRIVVIPRFTVSGSADIAPFASVGVVLPVAGATKSTNAAADPRAVNTLFGALLPGATDFEVKSTVKGKLSVGANAQLGVKFRVSDALSAFVAADYTALRINRKSLTINSATVQTSAGETLDIFPALNAFAPVTNPVYTYTEYVDTYGSAEATHNAEVATSNTTVNGIPVTTKDYTEDYPFYALGSTGNFSTVGLNVGVTFSFGGGSSEE
jgi:hypothetical protein